MTVREQFDLPAVAGDSAVYGTPYRTTEGTTVIPVTRPRGRLRRERPLGIFVVGDNGATWHAVTDDTAIALLGIFVGLVATTLSLAAVIKRPPWPDVRIRVFQHKS
ncbi:hypothetical protein NONO_c11780 [Nocardia nova SH22a]|uniref:Uncharacterized protein n=1 Tax=Nocardia nova SH22a TaxID=1415166 RepID=W5T9H6_9NOCA|nr:hypothetical protein [Nocardia nova]AHH15985.1 hypothetical protein NONO_c11780 [Nocardia nova SH22a]